MKIKLAPLLNMLKLGETMCCRQDPVYTRIKNVINIFDWIVDKSSKRHPKCRISDILEKGLKTPTVGTSGR